MGHKLRRAGRVAAMLMPFALAACQTLIKPAGPCGDDGCSSVPPVHEPKVTSNPTMHALASDLDHLEKHVDWYGSVVAKAPDVWGQARLTRYREEFDILMDPMKTENQFHVALQGSLTRSDQAFFAHATALSLAAQPKPPVIGRVDSTKVEAPALVPTGQTVQVVATDPITGAKTTTDTTLAQPTPPAPPAPPAAGPVALPTAPAASALLTDPAGAIKRELVAGRGIGFTALKADGIGLEPSLLIAQKKRHLDFLNQIRRENEGSDTADGPGYSLNLIRVPVSLLPGKRTDTGHGAEITMTLTPVLGDELLPVTFRNLVTNDLLHQLGFPLTQVLDDKGIDKLLTEENKNAIIALPAFNTINDMLLAQKGEREIKRYIARLPNRNREGLKQIAKLMPSEDAPRFNKLINTADTAIASLALFRLKPEQVYEVNYPEVLSALPPAQQTALKTTTAFKTKTTLKTKTEQLPNEADLLSGFKELGRTDRDAIVEKLGGATPTGDLLSRFGRLNEGDQDTIIKGVQGFAAGSAEFAENDKSISPQAMRSVEKKVAAFAVKLPVPSLSYSAGLTNKTGFPTSQLLDVYGLSDCFQIAFAANIALKGSIARQGYAHLPDVQGFLQQEIASAYRFLAEPGCQHLWQQFCTRDMVTAVRTRNLDVLQDQRQAFRDQVKELTGNTKKPFNEPGEYSTNAALAWCILIDSALLNDRLVRDMKEAASAKKQAAPSADHWPQYYLPEPPAEARCAFNAYVAMRWPIRVFALDPYTQDQNIADQFSSRREMQLALSIAFTNGFIGADTLTKYTRRLEAEYETIALNRTQVGFSHGENTFGWRFYPRFQTPDTEGNLTVFFRDQLIGGPNRNALLRQRRLEPGPRECVAVVMMPSFVPYATLDTTSNWFGLANPKHKVMDHTQALKLSHTVHTIKNGGCGVKDANCYRDGELDRLLRRAEQLEARLPAQTLSVPVPVINTLGGFEMFSNGTTDLAPELYGWYGAPGVSADDDATTLFLVGDHFSPLNTKVIVGNRSVSNAAGVYNQKMLSRQVVQVTVSKGTLTVLKDGKPHVTAHIATPYGVTRELLIPVVSAKVATAPPQVGFSVGDSKVTVQYAARAGEKKGTDEKTEKKDGKGATDFVAVGVSKELKLAWTWADPATSTATDLLVQLEFGDLTTAEGIKVTLAPIPCKCGLKAVAKANPNSTTNATVVIDEPELQRLAADLVRELTAAKIPESVWAAGLKSTKVIVTPIAPPGQSARGVVANDQLTVEFKRVADCGNALKPGECPPEKMPVPMSPPK